MAAVSSISSRCTFCPCGPVWCVTSCMPRMFLACSLGVFAGSGHLHAAALAAASGVNLRLDHDARSAFGKQFARHCRSFFQACWPLRPRYGHAVPGKNFLCLILVDFYLSVLPTGKPANHAGETTFGMVSTGYHATGGHRAIWATGKGRHGPEADNAAMEERAAGSMQAANNSAQHALRPSSQPSKGHFSERPKEQGIKRTG